MECYIAVTASLMVTCWCRCCWQKVCQFFSFSFSSFGVFQIFELHATG